MKTVCVNFSTVILAIILGMALTGCAAQNRSTTQLASNFLQRQTIVHTTDISYPPKNPKIIALYTNKQKPLTPYRVIGIATVSKYNLLGMQRQEKTVHDMMVKLAASIGGDGLIDIQNNDNNLQARIIAFQKILI